MGKVVTDDRNYKRIAAAIRSKTGSTDTFMPTQVPDEIDAVFEAGKKTEYDSFWDSWQEFGNRRDYTNGFCGTGWKDDEFYPKYNLKPYQIVSMFGRTRMNIDLARRFEDCKIVLDLSSCGSDASTIFFDTQFNRLPALDFSRCTKINDAIGSSPNLVTVDSITINENATVNRLCGNCAALQNIQVLGTIGNSGIDLAASSKLSHDSIASFVNALSKKGSGKSITFSQDSVNREFETQNGLCDGSTSEEWLNLIATRANWTVSLV